MKNIFKPYNLSGITLNNRIVMAPMTRSRCPNGIANSETAHYYKQRASAGLIITEGTPISQEGIGYINIPGIWTDEQADAWKLTTDAVHEQDGKIFAQLWHVGRVSHTSLQPNQKAPVSSTNKPVRGVNSKSAFIYLDDGSTGFVECSIPRKLEVDEIKRIVQDFVNAGKMAKKAGFDGIEIHAANGYLFEQFFNPILNDRKDEYGGSVENRARFLLEVFDALTEVLDKNQIGIRLSPNSTTFDLPDYDFTESYLYIVRELSKRSPSYIHFNDNMKNEAFAVTDEFLGKIREVYSGTIILAGSMTKERAIDLVNRNLIDLPAFGKPFISNPDLVKRFHDDLPLTAPDYSTFYGGDKHGYTDYPTA